MQLRRASIIACIFALTWLTSCIFSKYSRRDRFVSEVLISSQKLSSTYQKRLVGKPLPEKRAGAVKLPPGAMLVVRIALPDTYQGFCESLTIHLPKEAQREADYQIWVAGKPEGPWLAVGRAVASQRFDIDDLPFSRAHFVKVRVAPTSGHSLWLDAVQIRVHLPDWQPLLKRRPPQQSPPVRKRSLKHAARILQEGLALLEQQVYPKALEKFKEALPWYPRHAGLAYAMAATYYGQRQHYQAIRHFRRAFALAPPTKEQREEYGESFYAMRLLPQALSAFQRCIAKDPWYPRCYYHRLATASLNNRREKALIEMYRDAFRLVTVRTNIARRKIPMSQFLARTTQGSQLPIIHRIPARLPLYAHLDWFLMYQHLFPNDKAYALQHSLRLLKQFAKAHPKKYAQSLIYQGIFYARAGHPKRGDVALRHAAASLKGTLVHTINALRKGLRWEHKGKTAKAQRLYRQTQAKHPSALMRRYLEHFP